jgi:molecular chaperone IbpA
MNFLDLPFAKAGVGIDKLFNDLQGNLDNIRVGGNYPPYNIVQHDADSYSIELAVAGLEQDALDVTVNDNVLTIETVAQGSDGDQTVYLHRGISQRCFSRKFVLGEHVQVKSAGLKNGLLTVALERVVPEECKPRKVAISYAGE